MMSAKGSKNNTVVTLFLATVGPLLVIPTYPLTARPWGEAMDGATVSALFFVPMMVMLAIVVAVAAIAATAAGWGAALAAHHDHVPIWRRVCAYACALTLTAYLVLWIFSVVIAVAHWGNMVELRALGPIVRGFITANVVSVVALWLSYLIPARSVE